MNFEPLETERLLLRPFMEQDRTDLYEYLSDARTVEYEPYKPMTEREAKKTLAERIGNPEYIAVILKGSGKMIGNLYMGEKGCLNLELGYVFNRAFWGKGYAAEACRAAISYAFMKGAHRIYAQCDTLNSNSWQLLERLGFKREATFIDNTFFWTDAEGNPIWKNTYVYSLLAY